MTIPREEILALVRACIEDIGDDYRASGQERDDETPAMDLTVATDDHMTEWTYQTGDNSYSGGAYALAHWAVVTLTRDADAEEIANDIFSQWAELTYDIEEEEKEQH